MKLTLTYIRNEEKTSKAGKKYTACSIKTLEHGDKWLNGFGNAQTKDWEERKLDLPQGENLIVEAEVFEEEYNGQKYTKFRTISETTLLSNRLDKLEKIVKELYTGKKEPKVEAKVETPPVNYEPSIKAEDLPW